MTPVVVDKGDSPLILAMPHVGTYVPDDVARDLNATGRALADTDWHIDRLYKDLAHGATTVRATWHRYVIDVNRDPSGVSLYPGQNTTGLCPTTDFDGKPIWTEGRAPDAGEITRRKKLVFEPYHAALTAEVERIRTRHGYAVLYDCHSIRSLIPFLFEGRLPDLNIGTDGTKTCDPQMEEDARRMAARSPFTYVVNGRFRGGWTTRHYGKPEKGVYAIQMELAQIRYLEAEAPPWTYSEDKGRQLRATLVSILSALLSRAAALHRAATT